MSDDHLDQKDEIAMHERAVRAFIAKRPFCRRDLTSQELTLYSAALTHDSYCSEAANLPNPRHIESYERLEFLGDAVVELIACEQIYLNSELKEGKMTDLKQDAVANRKISEHVLDSGIGIDGAMLVGHGHRDRRTKSNIVGENMRADAFEALIGATYILHGLDEARRVVKTILGI